MKEAKLSIILPVYNAEKYIERCIESILYQQYSNIEIIIINDGSTDETQQILNQKYKHINKIKIENITNSGVATARNLGIQVSTGKYLIFIDVDDVIPAMPNLFQQLIDIIEEHNLDLLITGYQELYLDGKKFNKVIENEIFYKSNQEFMSTFDVIHSNNNVNLFVPWGKVYLAKNIKENCLSFPKMRIGEDIMFNLGYYKISNKIKIIQNISYVYLVDNEGSAMQKYYITDIRDRVEVAYSIWNSFNRQEYWSNYLLYTIQDSVKNFICNSSQKKVNSYFLAMGSISNTIEKLNYYEFKRMKNKLRLIILKFSIYAYRKFY